MEQRILLLDRQFAALNLIGWRRALKLLTKDKAEAIGENTFGSINGLYPVPTIIRLVIDIPFNAYFGKIKFSKKNVLLRDGRQCQYCGTTLTKASATIDHIVPLSRGGLNDYTNCVACCKGCNNLKGGKTPAEIGFKLIKIPKQPTHVSLYRESFKSGPPEWSDFITFR